MTSFDAILDRLVRRHAELRDMLSAPATESSSLAKLSKEYSDLTPLVESVDALRKAQAEMEELGTLAGDAGDPEMRALAGGGLQPPKTPRPALQRQTKLWLLPRGAGGWGARGGGGGHKDRREGSALRRLPPGRSGRPAGKHHRQRGSHPPSAAGHGRAAAGREVKTQKQAKGAKGAPRPPLRHG